MLIGGIIFAISVLQIIVLCLSIVVLDIIDGHTEIKESTYSKLSKIAGWFIVSAFVLMPVGILTFIIGCIIKLF